MSDTLLIEENDGIIRVTFNRPEKYNAISREMMARLAGALQRLKNEPSLKVMQIKANGEFYSSGMDIKAGLAPRTDSGIEFRDWYRNDIHKIFDEIESIEKPIIACIQGPCLGGALEMALSCDFRLASDKATFSLPETKIGALPGSGGVSRLTRLVSPAEAKWMVMAAKTVDAQRALRTGMIHEVYDFDIFEGSCDAFLQELCTLPPEVVGMAKLTIGMVEDMDRNTARDVARIANTQLSQSKEHIALLDAFLKRKK